MTSTHRPDTEPAPPASPGLEPVARLERSIGASLERVWENVLDWEHLPWLHRHDFASIDLHEAGEWGWRARLLGREAGAKPFELELITEREAGRYVSRTLTGRGAGTEIWTQLEPTGPDKTDIRVDLLVPGVSPGSKDRMRRNFLELYGRLWDEDEAMMQARSVRLAEKRAAVETVDALDLGPRDALLADLPRCIEFGRALFRIVELDGSLVIHDARCPHLFGPLDESPEGPDPGIVQCPWHGYTFDVRTGQSADGRRLKLRRPPRIDIDAATGHVVLRVD